MFGDAETVNCSELIRLALDEDLGSEGDRTGMAVIPEGLAGSADFVARQDGVLAGWPAVEMVFTAIDPEVVVTPCLEEGAQLRRGTRIGQVCGRMRSVLAGERTALNFLQHLSGIASLTRQFVDAIRPLPCKLLDTRKTLPGWRRLAKYAVRCGGGTNHRLGLHDGILIKDNHLAALGTGDHAIRAAVERARRAVGTDLPIEIEVDNLEQFDVALACRPDIILLDNMTTDQLRQAVRRRDASGAPVALEASGGVTLATVRAIAETGVDRISVGLVTHSAPALDIGLDYQL